MNRVRYERLKRILNNFHVDLETQIITNLKSFKQKKVRINNRGYCALTFSEKNKSYGYTLHEIIAFKAYGDKIIDLQINHLDGNKTNNHPTNLEVTNAFGNMKHAYDMGLLNKTGVFKKGQEHPLTQLTDNDVIEMRKLYAETKLNSVEIAKKYGISHSNAMGIIKGNLWNHVTDYNVKDFENLKKRKYKEASLKGENRSSAKLTEDDVKQLRLLYRDMNITMKQLGEKFGVKDNTVSSILTGDKWGHITFPDGWDYEQIRKQKAQINKRNALNNKHGAKLTEEKVKKIRELYKTGEYTQKKLSEMFQISNGRISEIVNYKAWN